MNLKSFEFIKKHEGFSATPYRCSRGAQTIGYGRNLDADPWERYELDTMKQMKSTQYCITQKFAEFMLKERICEIEEIIGKHFDTSFWSEYQKAAIADMIYQLGERGFFKFTKTIEAIHNNNWKQAVIHAMESNWAIQTPNRASEVVLWFTR